VSGTPDKDIKNDVQFFKANCHELERSPHPSCESGTDKACGPIDPKYPGRWVVPCPDSTGGDQVVGGPSGKMAYKIPNKEIKHGVIQAYWLTQNTCNAPDGFMDNYKYPSVWAGCPCDGGATGAHPKQKSCTATGQIPEEFFTCADVQVSASGSSSPEASVPASSGTKTTSSSKQPPTSQVPEATTEPSSAPASSSGGNGQGETPATTSVVATTRVTASRSSAKSSSGGRGNKKPLMYQLTKATTTGTSTAADSSECPPEGPMPNSNSSKQLVRSTTCVARWAQCGGYKYEGPTECCDPKFTCVMVHEQYYQCKGPPAPVSL
jgi:Fungal cellulose binding domain